MSYRDRGMMKWQGFVLSEHSEDISFHNRKKTTPVYLDEQSLEIFNELLLLSYKNQTIIQIEYANTLNPYEPIKRSRGYVWKYDAILKCVHLKDEKGVKGDFIPISEIRYISEVENNGV